MWCSLTKYRNAQIYFESRSYKENTYHATHAKIIVFISQKKLICMKREVSNEEKLRFWILSFCQFFEAQPFCPYEKKKVGKIVNEKEEIQYFPVLTSKWSTGLSSLLSLIFVIVCFFYIWLTHTVDTSWVHMALFCQNRTIPTRAVTKNTKYLIGQFNH